MPHLASNSISGLILCVVGLCSCRKDNALPKPDIDVVGAVGDLSGRIKIKFWKNSVPTDITDDSFDCEANAIVVDGSNVYVSGFVRPNSSEIAKLWTNGAPADLSNGSLPARAYNIAISGNDIYVAGHEGQVARYWKNGFPVILTDPSRFYFAYGVAVSGSDVYVAGAEIREINSVFEYRAVYSKNNLEVDLSNGAKNSFARSIFVSGNDVYVAGSSSLNSPYPDTEPVYWKNGTVVPLTNGKNGEAVSITVSGNDVYVVGIASSFSPAGADCVLLWKSGRATYLSDGSVYARPKSVAISGRDIFVSGEILTTRGPQVVYWHNGRPVFLTGSTKETGYAGTIFLAH